MEIKTCEQYVLAELADAKKKAVIGEATAKLVAWVKTHAHITTGYADPSTYYLSIDSVYSWEPEFEVIRELLGLELPIPEAEKAVEETTTDGEESDK